MTRIVVMLALWVLSSCGDDGTPGPSDAAVSDGGCAPQSAASFSPVWKPPQAMLNACTDAQIDEEYRLCESASGSVTECRAFNRDPANAPCRTCLYSTDDESTQGPFVYLKNRVLTVNVPGCLALADGHRGPNGCGAQVQAYEACKDAVCIDTCVAYADYARCVSEAGNTVCQPYLDDSACGEPATYAPCVDHDSFEDFFRSLAKVFCGAGFPGRAMPDGGRDDAGRASAALAPKLPPRWPANLWRGVERDALRFQMMGRRGEGLRR
jgi:hypothetical protein